jgi:hypothetical protein
VFILFLKCVACIVAVREIAVAIKRRRLHTRSREIMTQHRDEMHGTIDAGFS